MLRTDHWMDPDLNLECKRCGMSLDEMNWNSEYGKHWIVFHEEKATCKVQISLLEEA